VTFSYRDRCQSDIVREMTLAAPAFLRRFLLHLLPKGFVKIRSYGLLANAVRKKNLARCRELLGPISTAPAADDAAADPDALDQDDAAAEGICLSAL